MSEEDDDIQRKEREMKNNCRLFSHDLINFIIPNSNTGRMIEGIDIAHTRRIFDIVMRKAVTYLGEIYGRYAREIFREVVQQDWVHMFFFDWYTLALRDRLFRRGVRYDTFFHFSVFVGVLAQIFNHHGLHFAPFSAFDLVMSVSMYLHTPYDIEAVHRISQNYADSYDLVEAIATKYLCPDSIYPIILNARVSLRILQSLKRSSEKVMWFARRYMHMPLPRTEAEESLVYVAAVGDPLVRLTTKSLFSSPEFGRKRRRRHSVENNTENRNSLITSRSLDYIAIPGTSRDSNPGVIYPNPDEDQLMPTTSLRSRRCNKSELSESGSSKKAKLNTTSPNNQVMQCKNVQNKTNSPESIESTSRDTE